MGTSMAALLCLGLRSASVSPPDPGVDDVDVVLLDGCKATVPPVRPDIGATGDVTDGVSEPALDALLTVLESEDAPATLALLAAMRALCCARRCRFSSRRALASSVLDRPACAGFAETLPT